jgi:hypothetical protein
VYHVHDRVTWRPSFPAEPSLPVEARALITALCCVAKNPEHRLGSDLTGAWGTVKSHSFFSGTPSAGIAGEPSRVLPVWDLLSSLSVLPTVPPGGRAAPRVSACDFLPRLCDFHGAGLRCWWWPAACFNASGCVKPGFLMSGVLGAAENRREGVCTELVIRPRADWARRRGHVRARCHVGTEHRGST